MHACMRVMLLTRGNEGGLRIRVWGLGGHLARSTYLVCTRVMLLIRGVRV